MSINPSQYVQCICRFKQPLLAWSVFITYGNKTSTVGRYETKESAEAARALIEQAINTATSREDAERQIKEVEKMSDILYPQTWLDTPPRYVYGCVYDNPTGAYKARRTINNYHYTLGGYAPSEIPIAERRLQYISALAEKGWSNKEIDEVVSLFRKIQRGELTTLESIKTRLAYTTTRVLGVCLTNEDGQILANASKNIDTIKLYDIGLLSDSDMREYWNVLFYNTIEWSYLTSPIAKNLAWRCKKSVHILRTIGKE